MNIIIVGCGKVGHTLVEQLGGEQHDIVVVDLNPDKVHSITDELDAQGIVGNGVSYQTLQEAGIDRADLLIAVTASDEQNLLCCCIARQAGHCKTIARVRNPLYNEEISFLRDKLGLDLIINPELLTANEIARIFQFPSAVKIDTFSKGRLELIHFRVTKECLLNGLKLMNLKEVLGFNVLIPLVTRGDEVIIPRGDFSFEEGDVASVATTAKTASMFFRKIGFTSGRTRTAMLVGGGTISYYLAKRLLSAGINTKIIEIDDKVCSELSEKLPEATIICGDGTDERLLLQEGLESADGFVALTGLDEENILLALLARKLSNTKAVSKINRINFNSLLGDIKLDTTIFPRLLTANLILRYARSMNDSLGSNVENLYRLEDGKAEALEFYVKEPSGVTDTPLMQLSSKLKKDINICSITRGNQIIFPTGQDEIKVGDYVVIVMKHCGMTDIKDILK
ncbi:MAG: Trk system potassium transporter TrkA [Lachnospiraceae bacterium]|nr:Trk system potassium transporter TrkA [Lachnospiraceae bacterium]